MGQGEYLVLSGGRNINQLQVLPLLKSGPHKLGSRENPESTEPWYYIGVRFETDSQVERLQGQVDKSKTLELKEGAKWVRYLADGALPPGDYTLMAPNDRRTYMVAFGPAKTEQ